jgi:hypothetical protein
MNDLSQKQEFAQAAEELLGNKAFSAAILDLRKRWFDELLASSDVNQEHDLKVMIKALEAIPAELQIKINDYRMAQKRQAHG